MDDEELSKIIHKLEAMMKSTDDSSRHIASSIKALPDTLSMAVDDAIFDRVQSLGADIGNAISKELGVRADILESTVANITDSFATITKFIRLLQVLAMTLLLTLSVSVVFCVLAFRAYLSVDLSNSVLLRLPPHVALPAPAPLPPAQNSPAQNAK